MKTDLENFPTNKTAKRMLRMVSPIYDESYVGKWLFQAIGAVTENIVDSAKGLAIESHPETCTWTIPYWEEAYGIYNPLPVTAANIEERRKLILRKRKYCGPMNPARIAEIVTDVCGRPAEFIENVAPHTFEIHIKPGTSEPELGKIIDIVGKVKQSQEHFRIVFVTSIGVRLRTEQIGLSFPFNITGTERKTGTYPYPVWKSRVQKPTLEVNVREDTYHNPFVAAGTRPDINTPGKLAASTLILDPDNQPLAYNHPSATEQGENKTGTRPSQSWEAKIRQSTIAMDSDSEEKSLPYVLSGTKPGRNIAGEVLPTGVELDTEETTALFAHIMAGNAPAINNVGCIDVPGIGSKVTANNAGIVHKACGSKKL